jgi:hypothetical protein
MVLFSPLKPTVFALSGGLRPPGLLRVPPINSLEQVAHLGGGQRHGAIHSLRPDDMAFRRREAAP